MWSVQYPEQDFRNIFIWLISGNSKIKNIKSWSFFLTYNLVRTSRIIPDILVERKKLLFRSDSFQQSTSQKKKKTFGVNINKSFIPLLFTMAWKPQMNFYQLKRFYKKTLVKFTVTFTPLSLTYKFKTM